MAHFAQLDENGFVTQVIVVDNSVLLNADGVEDPALGLAFCKSLLGEHTTWVQTSYNGNLHNKYAGIGDKFDPVNNAFIPPKPYPSWVLNPTTFLYEAPVPFPTDDGEYGWDEDSKSWMTIQRTVVVTPDAPVTFEGVGRAPSDA
jgi:hypothetical protein